MARSGFYFYFDSKYAVLAVILADARRTRRADPPLRAARAGRVARGVRQADGRQRRRGLTRNNDPIMAACTMAQNTDAQIREMMNDFDDG